MFSPGKRCRRYDTTPLLWLGLLGCTPRAPYFPPSDSADSAAPSDTAAPDDTGQPIAEPPWPLVGDGIEPQGEMDCDNPTHPCNHQIQLGVGDGSGSWSILDTPLAIHASVANVVPIDYGEWDGEPWGGLWLSYVDVFPGNLPDDSVDNVITVASVAFPWSAVQTPAGLEAVLRGDGPYPWVFQRTDTWTLGFAIVDPERELVQDGDRVRHLMLVVDLGVKARVTNGLYLLDSEDGIHFTPIAEVDTADTGTDPDCHPIGWDGPYPGVLPETWGPDGSGEWACNVSGADEFTRYEGTLLSQAPTDETVRGITVTATAHRDGTPWATGHVSAGEGLTDMVEVAREEDAWGRPSVVIEAGSLPGTENGIQAPTRLVLAPGVELLTFHTLLPDDE